MRSPKLPAAASEFAIFFVSTDICYSWPFSPKTLAGAEGFEPPSSVLETDSLTVELTPLYSFPNFVSIKLFHFLMRRMLTAPVAKLLQLQPLRLCLAVLRSRIVPLFAITALHRNDLSGHTKKLLAASLFRTA